jgi:hypothetical protein
MARVRSSSSHLMQVNTSTYLPTYKLKRLGMHHAVVLLLVFDSSVVVAVQSTMSAQPHSTVLRQPKGAVDPWQRQHCQTQP